MYIESVAIESFGSYKNYACSFGRGVNIIEGPNESGKTTLGAFIKFIFYGLGKKAPVQGALSEVKRYRSWENDLASGSLVLEYSGKKYRIERILKPGTRAQENVKIVDLESATECFKGEHPGKLFFGVEEDVFSQTAYVGQADGGKVNGKPISAAIENMLFSGDETVSTLAAQKKLDDARVLLRYKVRRGGRISELEDKIASLNARLDSATAVSGVLLSKESEKRELSMRFEKEIGELEAIRKRLERADIREKLDRFEYFDALVKNAEEKAGEYNALLEDISFDGFVPSEEYVRDIERLASDTERVGAKISQLEVNRILPDDAKITDDELILLEKVEEDGGISVLSEKAENTLERRKKHSACAKTFLAGGVLALIFCLLSALIPQEPSVLLISVLAILSLGAFSVSFLLFFKARTYGKNYLALTERYHPIAIEKIKETVGEIEKKRYLKNIYEQNNSSLKEKREEAIKEQEKHERELGKLLSKWGKEYDTVSDAYEIARDIRDKIIRLKNSEIQMRSAEKVRDDYANKLPTADRKALEDALEESKAFGDIEEGMYDLVRRDFDARIYENRLIEEDIKTLDIEIAKLSASAEDPNAISDEIAELTSEMKELEICHDGYMLAIQSISNATERLRKDVSPRLARRASEMMNRETRGKYSRIGVNENLSLEYGVDTEGIGNVVTREIDYLSEGTKDLAYISLRLALVEVLYTKAKPPILFDESFSRLDDIRLENTFSLIAEVADSGCQVFIFTSQRRDAEIMGKVGSAERILLE